MRKKGFGTGGKRATKQSVFGLLLALLTVFGGCSPVPGSSSGSGDAQGSPEGTVFQGEGAGNGSAGEITEKEDYFAGLPYVDYGGREFVIATTDPAFADSEQDSGILGSYLYRRNRAIEEKFNIKIRVEQADETVIQTRLQNASPDAPCPDLLYVPMTAAAGYAGRELLMNLYSVPFFDYDAPFAEPELQKDLTVADTAYAIYGSAAFDQRSAWCVYYNKTLMEELGFDPAALVKSGEWTWDQLLLMAESAMADLDGNRRMTPSVDRFGYSSCMNTTSLANAVFASFGKHYFTRDEDGFYAMDYNISDEDDYISVIRRICVTGDALYPARNPGEAAVTAFSEGRLAFFAERLSYAAAFAYAEVDWGILPMPARFPGGAYASYVDSSVCGYAVPYGVADSDLSGRVLTALYAYEASYGVDIVKNAWTYYYLRDNTSAAMLDVILEHRVYDIAYAFGEGFPDFAMASYELIQSVMENNVNFSYLYQQNQAPFSAFMLRQFVH